MAISYRLKTKELIFFLDIFGDPGSLFQGFGHIYIDRKEYTVIAEELNRKGMITFSGKNVFVERGISVIMKNIYAADTVFADSGLERWAYCTENMISVVRLSRNCPGEYLVEPYFKISELFEDIADEAGNSKVMDFYKGIEGAFDTKSSREILEEKYELLR